MIRVTKPGDLCEVDPDYGRSWLYLYQTIILDDRGYVKRIVPIRNGYDNALRENNIGLVVTLGTKREDDPDESAFAFVISPHGMGWVELSFISWIDS